MQAITGIQDVLDSWRELGSMRLSNGTELLGRAPDGDGSVWLHAIFPRLSGEEIAQLERGLGRKLPLDLRTFYRTIGGMSLFGDAFCIHGRSSPFLATGDAAIRPCDLLALDREIEGEGWLPEGAIAFAVNNWDQTVHVCGMGRFATEVVRVERHSGVVLQRHDTIWDVVVDKLQRLDELFVRDGEEPAAD